MKFQGFIRERRILKKIFARTVKENSPMYKKYVSGISEVTGIEEEKVEDSTPAKNFFKKILDI